MQEQNNYIDQMNHSIQGLFRQAFMLCLSKPYRALAILRRF